MKTESRTRSWGGRLRAQGPGRRVLPPPLSPPLSQLRSHSLGCVMVPPTPRARGSFSRFLPELVGQLPVPQPSPHAPVHPAGLRAAGFLPGMAQPQVQGPSGFQPEAFSSLNLRSSWGLHSPQESPCLGIPQDILPKVGFAGYLKNSPCPLTPHTASPGGG